MLRLFFIFATFPLILQAQLPELIPYRKGSLWGYADSTGKVIVEPQWKWVGLPNRHGIVQVPYSYIRTKNDTADVVQYLNKYGSPIISYETLLDFSRRHFSYKPENIYMSLLDDTILEVNLEIKGDFVARIYYDVNGKMLFACANSDGDFVQLYSYRYVFNRQVVQPEESKKGRYYFADRHFNRKSPYFDRYEEEVAFNSYNLFILMSYDGRRDSLILNPDGPAARISKGKYTYLVDTNFRTLYKYRKELYDNIRLSQHPKDSIRWLKYPKLVSYPTCKQMSYRNDTFMKYYEMYFKDLFMSGVTKHPFVYEFQQHRMVNGKFICNEIPITTVRAGNLVSLIDTSGKILFPFKYNIIIDIDGHVFAAYDTVWQWINSKGHRVSTKIYKSWEWGSTHSMVFDTAWHFADQYGNILFEDYMRKGYKPVISTNLFLFHDPKRNIYIDKYGREYYE